MPCEKHTLEKIVVKFRRVDVMLAVTSFRKNLGSCSVEVKTIR